jgi:hypothetical protein
LSPTPAFSPAVLGVGCKALLSISFLLALRASSKVPRCLGHLALTELCQQYSVNRTFSTLRANDGLLESGAHGLFIDPYLAHIAIEFFAALFALEVDRHVSPVSSSSLSPLSGTSSRH